VCGVRDEDRTKGQPIDELVRLRRRYAELEESEQPLRTGEILVKMGYVTRQQLEEALIEQQELSRLGHRQKLLSIMVESGIITEEQLRTVLAIQSARIAIR
jgi:predicted HTH transcriptional regulator